MNSYPRNPKYDFPEELVSGNKEYTFKLKGKNRDGQAVYDMIDNKTGETVGSEYSFSDNIGLKRIAYSVERPIELEEIKEFFSNTVDMAELEFELKRIKKENPGKKVTYFFTKDDPKGYKIQIKEFFSKPLDEATKEEETKFHKKLDTLVHNTFGKRKGEMEEVVNYSPEGKDKIYSLISQALQQGKLTKDAQAVFMKWMADPNSTEEAIIKALESITGGGNIKEGELTEAYVPSNIKEFAKRKGISSLVNKVAGWAEKVGARITGGTAIGKNYDTLILDMGYQTADIYINIEDGTIELYGEPADSFPQFKEAFMDKVTRDEIEKDENQFRREQGLEETLVKKVMERLRKS